jgi:predicted phosphate transport protein (TIGR00153 family)
MAFSFLKKYDFYKQLVDQAEKTQQGLLALTTFSCDPTPENQKAVSKIEEEADELRRILIEELNRTFVTPIDREDIFSLSRSIDDVMDYAETTVEEMTILKIEPNDFVRKMVEILYNATKDIVYAVKNIKDHPASCSEHIIKARKGEKKMENLYRQALADLFNTNDVIKILKTREIYRHLSNAADRVVDAADIIGDIIVKNT